MKNFFFYQNRGPNGVWTNERNKEKSSVKRKSTSSPVESTNSIQSFVDCTPTYGHMAIISLIDSGRIHYVISQNIDGLFVKANIPRSFISELHGDYFVDECSNCKSRFIRNQPTQSIGCKSKQIKCPRKDRFCRGKLRDTVLDWEQALPENELQRSETHCKQADLIICLGTTLQIEPVGSLPLLVVKNARRLKNKKQKLDSEVIHPNGHLVIVNLQPTIRDKYASLVIHHYIDHVLRELCTQLHVKVNSYDFQTDPTKSDSDLIQWNR